MNWCSIEDETMELIEKLTKGVFVIYLIGPSEIRDEQSTWSIRGLVTRLEDS